MIAIFSRVRLNRKQVISVVLFTLLATISQMMIPLLVSFMINDGVSGNKVGLIILLGFVMIGLAVLSCVLSSISAGITASITTGFCGELRKEIFHKVESFSAADLDRFGTSSLITRNTTDVTMIQTFLSMALRMGLLAPMMAAVGLVLCVVSAGKVSVVLVIAIPLLILGIAILTIAASRYSVRLRSRIDDINQLFLEALEGVRVIRAFNKQEHEIERFRKTNEETAEISRKSITMSGALMPVVQTLFGTTSIGAMIVGSVLIIHGQMEVGTLVSATQYISLILVGIILLSVVVGLFPDTYACMKRIGEVLETEPSIQDSERAKPESTCRGTVEYRNVTFSYPGATEPVIRGISFVSKPGETTAIIGRTGCGKSSIIKLIPRLYDVTFGEVLVDGVNVRDYRLEELRDIIGYVPQKNVLFSGDIAGNLNFGNERRNRGGLEGRRCGSPARPNSWTERTGLSFPLAQGGTNFSGGQRQRLAIARAVMKKPEIYLFDDSFSALDMKTDKQLRQNLKESMGDATMIVVAQRVNTIMDATRIIVLDNGEAVGHGNP